MRATFRLCAVVLAVSLAAPVYAESAAEGGSGQASSSTPQNGDPHAPKPATDPKAASEAAPAPSPIAAKWSASLYGFVEMDAIQDSTQGLNDLAGNGAIARPDSYAGDHEQLMFSARNSRIGFKLAAPDYKGIRASAILEMDFLGNQPPNASEGAFFTNGTFRFRHMAVKIEDRYVDVLAGQYWQLFGWQSYFHPNTVEFQGLPGQVYSRSPQIRISHLFKTSDVNVEIAAAASRPPERAANRPDGQGAVRLLVNNWKGLRTVGSTGTSIDAMAFGVSGVTRRFAIPEFSATPVNDVTASGWGVSFDALVPIIAATTDRRANALTFTGSFVRGAGIADLYTGLSGGVTFPALPGGGTYTPNIDNGLVGFDAAGDLQAVDWESYIVGLQYYLPATGKVWLSANYSHMSSDNAADFGTASKIFDRSHWADANVFWDVTPAVRVGLESAWFEQTYADGVEAKNRRLQLAFFYLF